MYTLCNTLQIVYNTVIYKGHATIQVQKMIQTDMLHATFDRHDDAVRGTLNHTYLYSETEILSYEIKEKHVDVQIYIVNHVYSHVDYNDIKQESEE